MAVQKYGVEIQGLKELRRDLNKVDPQLTKEMRGEFLTIGRKVAGDARSHVPQVSGRAAASVRAGVSGNTAYIAGGKKSVPYFGWLDFGSRTPRSGRPRSVGPWKKSGRGPKKGRFIYPAIDRNRPFIERSAAAATQRAMNRSFMGG